MACTELQLSLNIDHNCKKNDSKILNSAKFFLGYLFLTKIWESTVFHRERDEFSNFQQPLFVITQTDLA